MLRKDREQLDDSGDLLRYNVLGHPPVKGNGRKGNIKMAMINISIFKAIAVQKEVEEKFGVHMHIVDNCSGLYFKFDEEPAQEVLDFLKEYFANHEDGHMEMALGPNNMNFSLVDKLEK